MNERYKVYFAGPQVFSQEAESYYHYVTSLAREKGFVPLIPWTAKPGSEQEIFQRNLALLNEAHGCIASLNPFHGVVEPDSGTVWEVGYAYAQGKPVVGFMKHHDKFYNSMAARTRVFWRERGHRVPDEQMLMPDGCYVEDFGHPQNLMIQHSLRQLVESLPQALAAMHEEFSQREVV